MAANKPKKTANKSKSKKTKTEKSEQPEVVAETKKVEKTEKVGETVKAEEVKETKEAEKAEEKAEKTEKKTEVKAEKAKKTSFFSKMFEKKCDPNENILTIFHDKKVYGALIGEVFGTMFLTFVLLTLGVYQPLYIFFVILGLSAAIFGLSGANLNPIITVGMMASRRMSAIRGVLYMLAQILGAWLGYLIISAFWSAGGQTTALPQIAAVESNFFWIATLIEFMGAALIAFFFARALQYKRSALTFAMIVAGGFTITFITIIVISSTFLGFNANFILNPAVALMYQILPTGGDNIGELLADIALALVTYVIFPMLGGAIGFYLSDIASTFKEEDTKM